jgi:hypothetical protein
MAYQYSKEKLNIEGFSVDRELALRCLLFTLVFYLVASPQTTELFIPYVPRSFDVLIIQSLLFAIVFYLVSLYL